MCHSVLRAVLLGQFFEEHSPLLLFTASAVVMV